MEIFQRDARWLASADGGHRNTEHVAAEEREIPGPLEPTRSWERREDGRDGEGVTRFTLFAHQGVPVLTLEEFDWFAAPGNAWSERWETFREPMDPPLFGHRLRWTGAGWEPVGETATAPSPTA